MPSLIHLTTVIHAPVSIVFDLSRSIDLHMISTAATGERAIAGTTSGLINEGETVTWEARHLFKRRRLKVRITAMEPPNHFEDEMVEGDFRMMRHRHHFKAMDNGTIMIDLLEFESPYGIIGRWVDRLFMKRYLTRFLLQRNRVIKQYAESDLHRTVLSPLTVTQ